MDYEVDKYKPLAMSARGSPINLIEGDKAAYQDSKQHSPGFRLDPHPQYTKAAVKHLDPETLNEYRLPWNYDDRDTSYIVIEQWIPEEDLDILFEHTHQLQEKRLLTENAFPPLQVDHWSSYLSTGSSNRLPTQQGIDWSHTKSMSTAPSSTEEHSDVKSEATSPRQGVPSLSSSLSSSSRSSLSSSSRSSLSSIPLALEISPDTSETNNHVDRLMQIIKSLASSRPVAPEKFKYGNHSSETPCSEFWDPAAQGSIKPHTRYQCDIPSCAKPFFRKAHLDMHMRAHTNHKLFLCKEPSCGQRFSELGNLKTHELGHTRERPHSCETCGQRFANEGNLRAHQIVHEHTKTFFCKLENCRRCGTQFLQLGNLKSHQNKYHPLYLKFLINRFASIKVGERITAREAELCEYFTSLYIDSYSKDRHMFSASRLTVFANNNGKAKQHMEHIIPKLEVDPWRLCIIIFKASRPEICYQDMDLQVASGDSVIVEGDRGVDLGTVAHHNKSTTQLECLEKGLLEEHYRLLTVSSKYGNKPYGRSTVDKVQNTGIKLKRIVRIAQAHEVYSLYEKAENEARAKQICQRKAHEHHLNMVILDAEFQFDMKKLTFYYVADSYINLNALVTDLFKLYKTRVWMSMIDLPAPARAMVDPTFNPPSSATATEEFRQPRDPGTFLMDTEVMKSSAATIQPTELRAGKHLLLKGSDQHSTKLETPNSRPVHVQSLDSSSDQSLLHSDSDAHSTDTDFDLIDVDRETHVEDEEVVFHRQGADRVLDPDSYFAKLETMESDVASNSAIHLYRFSSSMPRLHCTEAGCTLRLCSKALSEESASDGDFYKSLHLSSHHESKWSYDILECRNILARSLASVKRMQDAKYSDDTFNLLVVDPSRPSVVRLVPFKFSSLYRLLIDFECTCKVLDRGNQMYYKAFSINGKDQAEQTNLEDLKYERSVSMFSMDLTSQCRDLLEQLGLAEAKPPSPPVTWRRLVHVIDLGLLSYAGAHLEAFDEKYIGQKVQAFYLSNFSTTLQLPSNDEKTSLPSLDVVFRRRRLQCLDAFLGHQEVWVFHLEPRNVDSRREPRLLLSTRIEDLANIWGPMWKSSRPSSPDSVYEYNIGNGVIVPWCQPDWSTGSLPTQLGAGEKYCHWISSKTYDTADVQLHQQGMLEPFFDGTETLLIGAPGVAPEAAGQSLKPAYDITCRGPDLQSNSSCDLSFTDLVRIKHVMWTKGALRVPRTRKPRRIKESQAVQVQASAMGFASLGNTTTYKRRVGHSMKDILVERWRHGVWNPAELASYGGIEISLCTLNARRRRLLDILGSNTIRKYLSSIPYQWHSERCKEDYFRALRDPKAFYRFWKYNPRYRESVGEAISLCLDALQETGVNEENHELSALWVEVFDYHEDEETGNEARDGSNELSASAEIQHEMAHDDFAPAEEWTVRLFQSEHTWTEFLQDTSTCLTVAIMDNTCLTLDGSYTHGRACQMSVGNKQKNGMMKNLEPGYAVLQTAIQVNDRILRDEGLKCEEKAWNISSVKKGARFSLGDQGSLTVYTKPSPCLKPPLCVEWHSVKAKKLQEFKDLSINEDIFGKCPEKHHQEYIRGQWDVKPLPVLIFSKSYKATLCAHQQSRKPSASRKLFNDPM